MKVVNTLIGALIKITFAHRIDRNNVGDYWSCPIHYYSKYLSGYELNKIEIKKIKGKMHSQTSPLPLSGGGLISEKKFDAVLRSIAEENQSKLKIIMAFYIPVNCFSYDF